VRQRLARASVAAAALLAALAISSCGGGSSISAIQGVHADCSDVQYAGTGHAQKLIVSDLPLKGASAERSRQMNEAIVQEIDRKGWRAGPKTQVAFQSCDDSLGATGEWDEALCRSNAQAYASDPDVIGVIGTYNSGCAAVEIPILNRARGGGIPMVSPGNTQICLTETAPNCEPGQPRNLYPAGKRNYARVVANDAIQGAGLASFAKSVGVQRPFILVAARDLTSKGQGAAFENAAKALGLQVAGVIHWDPQKQSYLSLMQDVKASHADAIVLAGLLEQNGAQLIRDKVNALGPNDGAVKLLAFDGFAQQATIVNIGPESRGMYVSYPGKVPGALTGIGAAFVNEMRTSNPENPIEAFAPYAGQAAGILLEAIRLGQTRAGTIAELSRTRVDGGILGSFAITPSGDPVPAPISVSKAGDTFTLERVVKPPASLVSAARGG
jgi:branched-chain amino acid transport system substrate-binding protein